MTGDDHPEAPRPLTPEQPTTGTIRIHRPAHATAGSRRVQVLIDGQPAAALTEGETVDCVVSTGDHQLWVQLDWAGNRLCNVTVNPGQRVDLHVIPDGTALSPLRHDATQYAFRLTGAPDSDVRITEVATPSTQRRVRWSATSILTAVLAAAVLIVILAAASGAFT